MENYIKYEDTIIDSDDIEFVLRNKLNSIDLNKILSAYEIAENVCMSRQTPFGLNCFNHSTRVCYLLIEELNIYDQEMLCAAILHDVFKVSNEISSEAIDFNFGPYTTYLIQCLTNFRSNSFEASKPNIDTYVCNDDHLIIAGAEHLDHIRCFEYDVTGIILKYIDEISKNYLPLIENNSNQALVYLKQELIKHRNKIVG